MDELWSRVAALWARLRASPVGVWVGGLRRGVRQLFARLRRVRRRAVEPARPVVDAASTAAARIGGTVRPGHPPILYTDGMVTLDHDGVVISSYYLPFGRRRIAYERIRGFAEYPLSRGRGFRVHGFGWPRQWYHRDAQRSERVVGLELHTDNLLRPVLTPADVVAVKELLKAQLAARR